jgi:hypothetical protein
MGRGQAGPMRAAYARVDAWGDEPFVEIVLLDMPFGTSVTLGAADYAVEGPPEPDTAPRPTEPDPAAAEHEKRRLIFPSLDTALRLVLVEGGPVTNATVTDTGSGTLILRLGLRSAAKAAEMGSKEWIHALRLINTWLSNDRRFPGVILEIPRVEAEADAIATIYERDDERQAAIARVLGAHVVEALNGVLGIHRH